jgi:hypothetical protein
MQRILGTLISFALALVLAGCKKEPPPAAPAENKVETKAETKAESTGGEAKQAPEEATGVNINLGGAGIKIGPKGVQVKSGNDEVNVGPDGVKVKSKEGDEVNVDKDGVKAKAASGEEVDVNKEGVKVKEKDGTETVVKTGAKPEVKTSEGVKVKMGPKGVSVEKPAEKK